MSTFCELFKALPPATDGISFAPTLRGVYDQQKKHPFLYWEFHELGGKQAVRKGKWKSILLNVETETPALELYDLENDPSEQHNLATSYPDSLLELRSLMNKAHAANAAFPFGSEKN